MRLSVKDNAAVGVYANTKNSVEFSAENLPFAH